MKLLVAMQMAWAVIVLLFSGMQFFAQWHWLSGVTVAIFVAYLYVSWALLERVRWAWWFSFLPPIVSLVLYGPNVGYNLWRASQLDPLFSDSPGTLVVVLVTTFVYIIPPIMLLLRLVIVRPQLLPSPVETGRRLWR